MVGLWNVLLLGMVLVIINAFRLHKFVYIDSDKQLTKFLRMFDRCDGIQWLIIINDWILFFNQHLEFKNLYWDLKPIGNDLN